MRVLRVLIRRESNTNLNVKFSLKREDSALRCQLRQR